MGSIKGEGPLSRIRVNANPDDEDDDDDDGYDFSILLKPV